MRSISLASRPAPISSSGGLTSRSPATAPGRGMGVGVGGGMRVRHVEPKLVALSAAIQPTRSSVGASSSGAGSTARRIGFSFSAASALTSTTTPTRDAPRRGASTRWPLVAVHPSGTPYENGWAIGASNATSATISPRSAAVVLPAGEFEIFPGHALVLLAGDPQQERGMERGDQHAVAVRMQPAAELADRLALLKQPP